MQLFIGSAYNTAAVSHTAAFYYLFICAYNRPPKVTVIQGNIKENTKGNYHLPTLISSKYQTNQIKLKSYRRPPQLCMKIYFSIFLIT